MDSSQDDWFDLVRVVNMAAAKQGMRLEVHLTRTSPTGGPLVRLISWPTAALSKPRKRLESVPCATTDGRHVIRL
jgi:hypothetical protein